MSHATGCGQALVATTALNSVKKLASRMEIRDVVCFTELLLLVGLT